MAIKSEYEALRPQLNKLALEALDSLGEATGVKIDLSGLLSKAGNVPRWMPNYNGVNLPALRAGGYSALADQLEKSGDLSVEVAEKGLVAIKKVLASDLTDPTLLAEANAAAIEASKAGLAALAALLPTPESLTPRYKATKSYSRGY